MTIATARPSLSFLKNVSVQSTKLFYTSLSFSFLTILPIVIPQVKLVVRVRQREYECLQSSTCEYTLHYILLIVPSTSTNPFQSAEYRLRLSINLQVSLVTVLLHGNHGTVPDFIHAPTCLRGTVQSAFHIG